MAWLRIDDGFAQHPKIAELTDREFRVWMRLLCYCARYPASRVRVTLALRHEVPGLDPKSLAKFAKVGLLDAQQVGGTSPVYEIHHWQHYNPSDSTAATRAKRYRERKAPETVTESSRDASRENRDGDRDANGASRAGRRARPVPSPAPLGEERPLGATPPTLEPQLDEPAESAERSPASRSNGRSVDPDEFFTDEPKTAKRRGKDTDVVGDKARPFNRTAAEAYVRNVLWQDPHPDDALRAQYADIPDDDLIELVELAVELARAHNPSPTEGAAA